MPRWIWPFLNPFQALFCFLWTVFSILAVGVGMVLGAPPVSTLRVARHPWSTVVLAVCFARVVRVNEAPRREGPCVYVANHQSVIDIPVLVNVLAPPLYFIAKRELFGLPIFGWYLRQTGMVPVDRGARTGGLDLRRFADSKEGGGLVAFPEGTRSRDGRLGAFKRGAFAAAIEVGIPIVPVAIENAGNVVGRRGLTGRPGTIRVQFGEALPTEGLALSDRAALAGAAREAIARMLGEELSAP